MTYLTPQELKKMCKSIKEIDRKKYKMNDEQMKKLESLVKTVEPMLEELKEKLEPYTYYFVHHIF